MPVAPKDVEEVEDHASVAEGQFMVEEARWYICLGPLVAMSSEKNQCSPVPVLLFGM